MYGMTSIGHVAPKHSREIASSRIGVGLEKLDRNLYDPTACYEPIGELGVKWVRIQSGWCRTESMRGVYDFSWLDSIVDSLLPLGTEPWMCLCYGNELYTPAANNKAGAVGRPPISTEEERVAWDHYVTAVVRHFEGRVHFYEIWNEPDGSWCWRPQPNAKEYGAFALRTARVIKAADPQAKVLVGSFCVELPFLYRFMSRELAEVTDYVTYHRYVFDVDTGVLEYVRNIRAILDAFGGQHIGVIQGETGAQSDYSTQGALKKAQWTERRQTKFLLRKIMIDLMSEVFFTSWFSTVDIFENIQNDEGELTKDWYGFFGLLGETFDDRGRPLGVYHQKQAYTAMQTLCSLFPGEIRKVDLPVQFECRPNPRTGGWDMNVLGADAGFFYQGFENPEGARCFAYWKVENIMTVDLEASVTLTFIGQQQDVHLIDPFDGTVYAIAPENILAERGVITLLNVPLRDYPLLITFGPFAQLRK
ncbi:MAG: beta-galactosidase [Eubacteriales bacterium]|nr:beta-galactosidase [Eubacteriales bacterium]